jgi:argininosuccinate synthase
MPLELVERVCTLAGATASGRVDHVEDRLVGIKSREIYEAPAATVLHTAHRALEGLTLSKDTLRFNRLVADELARLTYDGLWFSALHRDLRGYVASSQRVVSGDARIRLDHGKAVLVGRVVTAVAVRPEPGHVRGRRRFRSRQRGGLHRDLRPAPAGRGGPSRRGRQVPWSRLVLDRAAP